LGIVRLSGESGVVVAGAGAGMGNNKLEAKNGCTAALHKYRHFHRRGELQSVRMMKTAGDYLLPPAVFQTCMRKRFSEYRI
jgi:hypothetical protein